MAALVGYHAALCGVEGLEGIAFEGLLELGVGEKLHVAVVKTELEARRVVTWKATRPYGAGPTYATCNCRNTCCSQFDSNA